MYHLLLPSKCLSLDMKELKNLAGNFHHLLEFITHVDFFYIILCILDGDS